MTPIPQDTSSDEPTPPEPRWAPEDLEILYQDPTMVAIHKPAGMLVHRTPLEKSDAPAALQLVRDRAGTYVYPCHRLDRPTSGVLVFALEKDAARKLTAAFEERRVGKAYLAVVRGWPEPEADWIDHPLKPKGRDYAPKPDAEPKPARTYYRVLATTELPLPAGPHATARYAMVQAEPETGRLHQIRRHLKHRAHPVIGDTQHGDSEHNRLFREHLHSHRLLLACVRLVLPHPETGEPTEIQCPPAPEMARVIHALGWHTSLPPAWQRSIENDPAGPASSHDTP